ncbi:MAG: hypothetical protein U9P10_07845 [Thermodesulfobacteriota bacterium]|nr:hypothetical protein [Thermodesulfobacteriota bacterium]
MSVPELDITGALVQTAVIFFQPIRLATDPCSVQGGQGENSLVFGGRAGMPVSPEDYQEFYWDKSRLDMLLKTDRKGEKNKGKTDNDHIN